MIFKASNLKYHLTSKNFQRISNIFGNERNLKLKISQMLHFFYHIGYIASLQLVITQS